MIADDAKLRVVISDEVIGFTTTAGIMRQWPLPGLLTAAWAEFEATYQPGETARTVRPPGALRAVHITLLGQ